MTGNQPQRPERFYDGAVTASNEQVARIRFDRGHKFSYTDPDDNSRHEYTVQEILLPVTAVRPYMNGSNRVRLPQNVALPGISRDVKRQRKEEIRQKNEIDIEGLVSDWTKEMRDDTPEDEKDMP